MGDMIDYIVSNGLSAVVIAYFLFTDFKFRDEQTKTLHDVKQIVADVKEMLLNK